MRLSYSRSTRSVSAFTRASSDASARLLALLAMTTETTATAVDASTAKIGTTNVAITVKVDGPSENARATSRIAHVTVSPGAHGGGEAIGEAYPVCDGARSRVAPGCLVVVDGLLGDPPRARLAAGLVSPRRACVRQCSLIVWTGSASFSDTSCRVKARRGRPLEVRGASKMNRLSISSWQAFPRARYLGAGESLRARFWGTSWIGPEYAQMRGECE